MESVVSLHPLDLRKYSHAPPMFDCNHAGCGGNDVWGWTDPSDGNEIVIMGRSDGVTFIDVTDPISPVVLGTLDTFTTPSLWRDIKVFRDHAFIGSEASGHGMQIFDLTELRQYYGRDARGADIRHLSAAEHYDEFGNSHNVAINEDTGFAFVVRESAYFASCVRFSFFVFRLAFAFAHVV
eukprot:SAG11_NODE_9024_length_952_cov_1.078546_1_plen_181_part_00